MNPFRQLLLAHGAKAPIGTWVSSASPIVAEAVGCAGFDWGVLDMEHAPVDLMQLLQLLQAVGNTKMVPVVRVPWNDAVTVKRVLDVGAQTLLFPMIQNADEARRAVAATRYPPEGVRGMAGGSRAARFGTVRDYLRTANQTIGVVLQLETPGALARLEEIAAVPGVDALFVGPRACPGGGQAHRHHRRYTGRRDALPRCWLRLPGRLVRPRPAHARCAGGRARAAQCRRPRPRAHAGRGHPDRRGGLTLLTEAAGGCLTSGYRPGTGI